MKQQHIVNVALLFILSFSACNLFGQVTIGSGIAPVKAALLDLKSNEPNSSNETSSTGGLVLPRVKLINRTTLQPFIENSSDFIGNVGNVKGLHTGLTVYNMEAITGLPVGICVWDGAKWNNASDNGTTVNLNDAWLRAGNSGTDPATNFVGTTDAKDLSFRTANTEKFRILSGGNVGVGITNPTSKLHVGGTLTTTGATNLGSTVNIGSVAPIEGDILVRDATGRVGTALPTKPIAKAAFIQNKVVYILSDSEFSSLNATNTYVVVPFTGSEFMNHGLGTLSGNIFKFGTDALCEVSGYINYCPSSPIPSGSLSSSTANSFYASLNVTIQYSANNGVTWVDLAAARGIWDMASMHIAQQTITIPPAIRSFKQNDLIRMVIMRPANYGTSHGDNSKPVLGIPTGSQFSRGMKISTL